jgi:hypothetical protein
MGRFEPDRDCAANLITAEKRQSPLVGTALAINVRTLSCSLGSPSPGWGGARNSGSRLSDRLTLEQCEKLIAAARFAELIGLPFNRHWIVHSERAGIRSEDRQAFIGRLLRLAGNYARRRGGFAAIYVRENGFRKGEHIHILMHLPPAARLLNKTAAWVRKAGGAYRIGVSKVRTIGSSLARLDPASEHYQLNADNVLAYLLKGTDTTIGEALGLRKSGQFGWIIGKRCGSTENIAQTAQERYRRRAEGGQNL